jgi:2-dehydropantoate 2-reductase
MKIGIIGVGGVGGYFGGKICKYASAEETDVYFIARGKHLEEIRKKGLFVSTEKEGDWVCIPTLATDQFEELPVLDFCLLCVKSYDLKNTVIQLQPKVSASTIIIPLLNGIDIYGRIREDLHKASVLPACAYVGTHIETYGKITQKGGACKILFGQDPQATNIIPDQIFDIFSLSGIKYEWFEDPYPEIWSKYMFIAAFALVTAAFDKTLGQVMESKSLSDSTLSVMGEIFLLSRKMKIGLPETIIRGSYEKGNDFPYETKTSFQRDFESMNKPDERDLFGGSIIRLGRRFGIDTPVTRELWDILNNRKPVSEKHFSI